MNKTSHKLNQFIKWCNGFSKKSIIKGLAENMLLDTERVKFDIIKAELDTAMLKEKALREARKPEMSISEWNAYREKIAPIERKIETLLGMMTEINKKQEATP